LFSRSLPLRYSETVTSMPIPVTSWKPASGPSVLPVPRSTRKLNWTYGRSRRTAMIQSFLLRGATHGVGGGLSNAEDDELGRSERDHADQHDQSPIVQVVLGHGGAVAAHEERLLGLVAQQRAGLPLVEQKILDRPPHVRPQRFAVRLEDRPLCAFVNRV